MHRKFRFVSQATSHRGGRTLYWLMFMTFFWTLFDGVLLYSAPLLIEERGFSLGMIGLIIASSSCVGALFDFIICNIFKNASVKRIFLVMFALCSIYPLLLWGANTLLMFLIAMALWGIYFDLYNFGIFDFVGRYTQEKEHVSSFGKIQIFRGLGLILAPLIAGFIIFEKVPKSIFIFSWIALGIGFAFCIFFLLSLAKKQNSTHESCMRCKKPFAEAVLWKKLGSLLFPLLFLTFFLFLVDAFFWTLIPLYAKQVPVMYFGGILLASYMIPILLVGWRMSFITKHFENKKVSFLAFFAGAALLSLFAVIKNPYGIILLSFLSSLCMNIAILSLNALYTDYISQTQKFAREIEGLEDFAFNLGYIIGPLSAGIIASVVTIPITFTLLGITGIFLALVLIKMTPKNIILTIKNE